MLKRILPLFVLVMSFLAGQSQSITVTAPNGGEILYACQTYTITWNATGTSNFYDIDYSLNNGAIWASVATNINVTNGQYVWTVPNVESNTCLIRVRDKNNTSTEDISNAVFSIRIPVVLTSPNGGESWLSGSQHPITWNIQGTSLTFNIDYSINGGSTWTSIVTNYSTSAGTYNWTVANTPSTNCLVRVRDAVTNCMQDVSNNTFTILPKAPRLTYPNGGEVFSWLEPISITWDASTYYNPVRIEYSTNNGTTWTVLITSTTNDGNYSWTIPTDVNSTQCLVKVSDATNVNLNDVSNTTFSILAPGVVITAPNGGESLLGCNPYTVQYTLTGTNYISPNVALYYSLDNGTNWSIFGSTTYSFTSGVKTYSWTVPNGISSTQCLIRARSIAYPTIADTSDAVFSITNNPAITVTSPNGGETFVPGTNRTITWTNTAQASGLYNVQYSTNGGSNYNTIASGISGNSYVWNVVNIPSATCFIRVQDAGNTCKNDVSDAAFTIGTLPPTMNYPNGGEQFSWAQPVTIVWNSGTYYNPVRIEYSIDNGTSWTVLTTSTTNDGTYSWTIPSSVNSTQCLVKVSDATNVSLNDVSNATFSIIAPDVVITAPNGGESLLGCNPYTVQYTLLNTEYISPTVSLYYSVDNGSSWSIFTSANYSFTSGVKTYSWTVPNGISSTQCLIRANSIAISSIADTSDAVFSITNNPAITVTSPNGGETFVPGTNRTITWTNTAQASGLYNVQYSTNGGSNYNTIASGISGNSYVWNVVNIPSATCFIRVQDAGNTCKNDVSDAAFTIGTLPPTMNYPNGGEQFSWAQPVTIVWNSGTYYNPVRIEYSIDNGTSWTVLTTSTTNDGTYSWTIPSSVNSTQCLVKVSDATNVNLNDVSNATFSIIAPDVVITAPNGGESLLGCNPYTVQYTLLNTEYISPTVSLYYSVDNGSSWSIFTSANYSFTSGVKTYSWTVPNGISSTQCLIRANSIAISSIADTSDAVFSITNNPAITVTSPNGGETFVPGTNRTITWTNTAQASGLYNVQYSTNGGSTYSTIASGISGNSYVWNVVNIPSATCFIRVQDAGNTCKNDVSDAAFTIGTLPPTMNYPNGGEQFSWAQPVTIVWNSGTYYNPVRIEYSTDNGTTWTVLTTSTTNDGTYSWTIPSSVNSTQCLVKVSDATNVSLNDVSNATFSIIAPDVVITAPNGGESLLGCNPYTVQYTLLNTEYISPTVSLYYSVDNGSSWSIFTSANYSFTSGVKTYSWTVPNGISSTQCLIRANSIAISNIADTSDAVFSIVNNPAITVTSPNGGETFVPGTNRTITWTNTAQASGLYNVQYSTNGGSTYSTIASGISGNSYVWNVVNIPSATCFIRVQDAGNTCKNDVSDAAFTIGTLPPRVTYPNGGEVFSWLEPISITWDASTYYNPVRIEYSTNNGTTWTVLITSTTNDGNYSWTIPTDVNSTQCLVKVSDATNVNLNDVSNTTFSILAPGVVITAPNGGESLLGCNPYTVQYTLTGTNYISPNVALYYSLDNGTNWSIFGSTTYSLTSGVKTYSWTVPNGENSTQCLIRARSIAYPTIADTSDAVFSIVNNQAITVTSPNGGENFLSGTSRTITWTNTAQASGLYNIQFSPNGGTNYSTIASGVSGNSYVWNQVINVPSNDCFIRVQDAGNTCKNDVSDAAFTILPRTPLLTYPNGGETFVSVSTINITWSVETFYNGTVRLEYSLDNGASWILITASTTNDGTQSWTLPFANSTQCLVKVSDATNVNLNDISNATFTITPIIQITNPNGLDELGACTQTSITFTHPSTYTSFDFAYSLNNGSTWTTITTGYTQTGTTGTYNWSIPNVFSTQARVRVSPNGNAAYGDISDNVFTIKPSVTLIQPNFGGTLVAGSVFPIKWNSDGISNLYDIAYSTTGSGGPWTNIVVGYNTATNTYNWTVPNILSSNCYIRITDNVSSCKQDISNFPFTIAASSQPVTVTKSNGLDTLQGCQNYTIQWTESGAPIGSYNIDLSTNGGVSWSNIAANYSTTAGSYNWIVPNIVTDAALIRVSSALNSTVFDASDAAFSIKARSIVATRDTTICTAGNLQLTATGGLGTFTWTPASGLNNANTANPVATITSNIQYVVSSSNGTCIISDTVSITLGKPIKVTVEVNTPVVCAGAAASFTAHATDAVAASYQWKKNNVNIGTSDSVLVVTDVVSSDVFTCTVNSSLPCVTAATSAGVSVAAYQRLTDTTVITGCTACIIDLTGVYSNSTYPSTTWSTNNASAARLGIYSLIGVGGSCRDTAVAYVNAQDGDAVRGCAASNFTFTSNITGSTYQWQQNAGFGWNNMVNNGTSNGIKVAGVATRVLSIGNGSSALNGIQYRCLVDGVNYSTVSTLKISTVWTGAVSTAWNVAGNWSCGAVPDANTDVFIYSGTPNNPVVTTSVMCRSITATAGTGVTVNTGGSINVTGK